MRKLIEEGKFLVNIDEAVYTRSIQQKYTWLPKGREGSVINQNCRGTANMIFALCQDGEWFGAIYNGSTNSVRFS